MIEQLTETIMKVIPFPPAQTHKGLKIEVLDETFENLTIGEFSITCPTCNHINRFDSKNTIFKTLEFFCGGCGHALKVTNPGVKGKTVRRNFKDV